EHIGDELVEADAAAVRGTRELLVEAGGHAEQQAPAISPRPLARLGGGVFLRRFPDGFWSRHTTSLGASRCPHNANLPRNRREAWPVRRRSAWMRASARRRAAPRSRFAGDRRSSESPTPGVHGGRASAGRFRWQDDHR